MYPNLLKKLIEDFQKLPGIGEKTAERLALHILTQTDDESVKDFAQHLSLIQETIKTCPVCGMLTDQSICSICQDETRERQIIMVVADAKDVFIMEKMKTYHGLYHVLGGLIDFSRGVTDKDLHIDELSNRLNEIKELIIATNGTVEGELTAKYLKSLFANDKLIITRLAHGLPVGADLKYADELTLSKAVENRLKY